MAAQAFPLRDKSSGSSFDDTPPYSLENWNIGGRHATSESAVKYQVPVYIVLSRYPVETYHLSKQEQKVFRSALRKSVKLLHKA